MWNAERGMLRNAPRLRDLIFFFVSIHVCFEPLTLPLEVCLTDKAGVVLRLLLVGVCFRPPGLTVFKYDYVKRHAFTEPILFSSSV